MSRKVVLGPDCQEGGAKATPRKLLALLRRNLTFCMGVALALWRLEAYLVVPLSLLLVATLGRWPGALVMGSLGAVYAALFLFLLDGERAIEEMYVWARGRRFLRRYLLSLAERRGGLGTLQRALALPVVVMTLGPFWRAMTFHLFRVPRWPAYALSVGGSIPHSLFWTGVVLGGLWEELIWPYLKDLG